MRTNRNETERLANQSRALRLASRDHAKAGNNWLANVMDFSSKHFAEVNRKMSEALDVMEDFQTISSTFCETRNDDYIYTNDDEFSSYKRDWFQYMSEEAYSDIDVYEYAMC